jgi:hypothetical protein
MHTRLLQALAAVALLAAPPAVSAATPATDDPFVVHEWGTFTTVQGADGEQIWWEPPASLDLPGFVYRAAVDGGGFGAEAIPQVRKDQLALARMETPVIYFYSQRERIADVRVLFRGGDVTEWYPQASGIRISQETATPYSRQFLIEWQGVRILPRDTREMTLDKLIRSAAGAGDHYYVARETDANFLRTSAPRARKGAEHERDLFYRGIGYFPAPLAVSTDANEQQLTLSTPEAEQIEAALLITIRQGMMRYQKVEAAVSSAGSVIDVSPQPFGALRDVRKLAMRDMARALVDAGLYEKEARAMVNTWQDQWFAEEGTRVLYLLPAAWTDRTLPLDISPRPDSVVRVMVGRAELITPSAEREIREQILTFQSGDAKAKARAVADVRELGLGRFLPAAFSKVTRGNTDKRFWKAAGELATAASARAPEDARSARN